MPLVRRAGGRMPLTVIAHDCWFGVDFQKNTMGGISNRPYRIKWVTLLCLLLTLWSALAFIAHRHSNGAESAKCAVCVAAHSAAPKAAVQQLKATFTSISIVRSIPLSPKERFVAFALSVRPPPAV